MPRHDTDHDAVKNALIKDGWTITHDPYILPYGSSNLFVDLGAERYPIAAEKDGQRIAVEVKSFRTPSDMPEWERALGQFVFYRFLLRTNEPQRILYLAMTEKVFDRLFAPREGIEFLQEEKVRVLLVNVNTEEIIRWIP